MSQLSHSHTGSPKSSARNTQPSNSPHLLRWFKTRSRWAWNSLLLDVGIQVGEAYLAASKGEIHPSTLGRWQVVGPAASRSYPQFNSQTIWQEFLHYISAQKLRWCIKISIHLLFRQWFPIQQRGPFCTKPQLWQAAIPLDPWQICCSWTPFPASGWAEHKLNAGSMDDTAKCNLNISLLACLKLPSPLSQIVSLRARSWFFIYGKISLLTSIIQFYIVIRPQRVLNASNMHTCCSQMIAFDR